jgi:hypothetical protein
MSPEVVQRRSGDGGIIAAINDIYRRLRYMVSTVTTNTLYELLTLNASLNIPTDAASGKLLTSDASGNASWAVLANHDHSGDSGDGGRVPTSSISGSTVVYDDLRILPGSFDRPGTSDPTIVAYAPGGGAISTYLWQFAKNNIASFAVQIPHGYKVGEDIKCHIHWTPGANGAAENGATVGWKVDYSWANVNGNFGAMATLDLSDACDGTDHKHQMTPDVTISGSGKGISSMLICNVKRTDTGADDTWAGTASGSLPFLLEIDFHVPLDTIGSSDWGTK